MIDFKKLAEPFPANDIEWRLQSSGKSKQGKIWAMALAYVTNRAIMERLDEVCGPENWKNEFKQGPDGGILCGLSIRVADDWVTKWDGAANTQVEAIKGGLSGAMKRAGSQWAIGRYLYNLDVGFAVTGDYNKFNQKGKTKEGDHFSWQTPSLPDWALPAANVKAKEEVKEVIKEEFGETEDLPIHNKTAEAWIHLLEKNNTPKERTQWLNDNAKDIKEDVGPQGFKEIVEHMAKLNLQEN